MKYFQDYLDDICQFYRDGGLKIDPVPQTIIDKTKNGEFDPFISTGNYNPQTNVITLFVDNRHLKDILRSYCHELVHRHQHLSDSNGFENCNKSGNLAENANLENIEGEAYRMGNLMFRRWTESKSRK